MMTRRISSILILTLVLMMSIIVIPNMTEKVSAGVFPLKVECKESTKLVDVGPGQPAFTSLTFEVSSLGPNPIRKVKVDATPSAGIISVTPSPSQFVVSSKSPQTVIVYISVDRNIEAPTHASVTLTATDDTGISAGASGEIGINQFSFLVIDPVAPYQEIPPATPFAYFFKIINQGNGPDPVRFEVVNEMDLKEKGWTTIIPPAQLVPTGRPSPQFVTVKVTGTTPRTWGWRSEFETITLKVISQLPGVNYSQQYTVTVFLRGFFVPAFDPMFSIIAIGVVAAAIGNRKKNDRAELEFCKNEGDNVDNITEISLPLSKDGMFTDPKYENKDR